MANQKKTYFLASGFDWPAVDGPVSLGNIVASVQSPQEPKNSAGFELPKVYMVEKEDWKGLESRYRNGLVGLWVRFLDAIGLGAQLSVEWSREGINAFEFKKMETRYFIPDDEYVELRIKDPKMQDFLASHPQKCYMITGLMIAHEPKASTIAARNKEIRAELGADIGQMGKIGPKIKYESGDLSATSYSNSTSFVFAVQYRAIRCKNVQQKAVVQNSQQITGGWYSSENRDVPDPEDEPPIVRKAELVRLFDGDVSAKDVGAGSEIVINDMDEGECECVLFG